MRRRAANHPPRCEPPPPPHPVPGPTNPHSAVWSVEPGTGSNGAHCPRAIGDWSPPFGPMPLPLTTHHRRGMGCGGGRPTTHRGVNLRRRRTPCPARPNVIRQFGPSGRARGRTANVVRARLATGRRRSAPCPYRRPRNTPGTRYRRGMGCGGGRPTTHRGDHRPPPHPVPGPTNRHSVVWFARRARGRTAHIVRARLATGRRSSAPCPYR